jgi:signal transduction histidine kinase
MERRMKSMQLAIIKYFAILVNSFYVYIKLQHITINKKLFFKFLLFSLLFTPLIYLLRLYAGPLSILIIVAISTVFLRFIFNTGFASSFNVSVISFGIAYVAYFLALVCITFFKVTIFIDVENVYLRDILVVIATSIFELLLAYILFKIRRLRKGIPSIIKYSSSDISTYLSFSLLFAFSSFDISQSTELVFIIPMFFILICGVTVIFWWRSRLTRKYIEDTKAREMEGQQKTIQEKDEEIWRLKQHNDELAKIIHKDNKLIPAMELAVREHLMSAESDECDALVLKGRQLLEQLESISRERTGIVISYETTSKRLPLTNVLSIDALMTYMLQKAKAAYIDFDLSVTGSIKYMIESVITEQDLNTLLADLIDNAIIATKEREKKHILSSVGICDDFYRIDIFDSGAPFKAETILNLGLKRTTTHSEDGGSGIGLMTAFQILHKYRASFEIDDSISNSLFIKKVSVCFDAFGQFRVKTNRDAPQFTAGRADIIFLREAEPI